LPHLWTDALERRPEIVASSSNARAASRAGDLSRASRNGRC
jgi:hypothetical protein